ncbi:hypothetical protein J6590_050709 [Homalodisca vitripennis]|nr:hypothetical protein J6590_050709 [Homalodisca vitripennis]
MITSSRDNGNSTLFNLTHSRAHTTAIPLRNLISILVIAKNLTGPSYNRLKFRLSVCIITVGELITECYLGNVISVHTEVSNLNSIFVTAKTLTGPSYNRLTFRLSVCIITVGELITECYLGHVISVKTEVSNLNSILVTAKTLTGPFYNCLTFRLSVCIIAVGELITECYLGNVISVKTEVSNLNSILVTAKTLTGPFYNCLTFRLSVCIIAVGELITECYLGNVISVNTEVSNLNSILVTAKTLTGPSYNRLTFRLSVCIITVGELITECYLGHVISVKTEVSNLNSILVTAKTLTGPFYNCLTFRLSVCIITVGELITECYLGNVISVHTEVSNLNSILVTAKTLTGPFYNCLKFRLSVCIIAVGELITECYLGNVISVHTEVSNLNSILVIAKTLTGPFYNCLTFRLSVCIITVGELITEWGYLGNVISVHTEVSNLNSILVIAKTLTGPFYNCLTFRLSVCIITVGELITECYLGNVISVHTEVSNLNSILAIAKTLTGPFYNCLTFRLSVCIITVGELITE